MPDRYAHCTFCGARFPADRPWPRRCGACGVRSYLNPKPVAVAGMLYTGLGDASAALVGKRFGRHRTSWGKSWEGFAAGLATSLAVGLAVPGISPAGD